MPTTLPDGIVRGFRSAGNRVAFVARVSCRNGVPTGTLRGTLRAFNGRSINTYRFISDTPYVVRTTRGRFGRSVRAAFSNVSLQQSTFTPITNCRAFLTAVRRGRRLWFGSLVIVCPNGQQYFFSGFFRGSVIVNRSVSCQPLLNG